MKDRALNEHVNKALELKRQIDELTKEFDKHKDIIKNEMTERKISEYSNSKAKVMYIHFAKRMFDKKSFEKSYPELTREYTVVGEQSRFTIA